MDIAQLSKMLHPESVAVIGASEKEGRGGTCVDAQPY